MGLPQGKELHSIVLSSYSSKLPDEKDGSGICVYVCLPGFMYIYIWNRDRSGWMSVEMG